MSALPARAQAARHPAQGSGAWRRPPPLRSALPWVSASSRSTTRGSTARAEPCRPDARRPPDDTRPGPGLLAFKSHEKRRRALCWTELQQRGRPRCPSGRLCGWGGRGRSVVTARFGRSAIAATTLAVERVVRRHQRALWVIRREVAPRAADAVRALMDDERRHHDPSDARLPKPHGWTCLLQPFVALSTAAFLGLGLRLCARAAG
ncbi:demethoxyubiquinone hydroxylase family protein [Roseateles subflavus]|uniref:demethoxyubiquinone hydroxylase family protein n=1 Tax=Roseateles subflavus TaxID=3053353 RepID=UPI0033130414